MKITFKPYRRRTGSLMLIVSGDNGCSVGFDETPFATDRLSPGQELVHQAAEAVFSEFSTPFAGDVRRHRGESAICHPYVLAIAESGSVAGVPVEQDGSYLLRDSRLLRSGMYEVPSSVKNP